MFDHLGQLNHGNSYGFYKVAFLLNCIYFTSWPIRVNSYKSATSYSSWSWQSVVWAGNQ